MKKLLIILCTGLTIHTGQKRPLSADAVTSAPKVVCPTPPDDGWSITFDELMQAKKAFDQERKRPGTAQSLLHQTAERIVRGDNLVCDTKTKALPYELKELIAMMWLSKNYQELFLNRLALLPIHPIHLNRNPFMPNQVKQLLVLPNSNIVTINNNTAEIWDTNTGQLLRTLIGHTEHITSFAVLTNDSIVTGSHDGIAKIWNSNTGALIHTLTTHVKDKITKLAVLPNGNIVIALYHGNVEIWNSNTDTLIHTLNTRTTDYINDLAVLPNGNIAISLCEDNATIQIWDSNSGQVLRTFSDDTTYSVALAALPNGDIVTVPDDGISDIAATVAIWDPNTGEMVDLIPNEEHGEGQPLDIAILSNGNIVTAYDGKTAEIWDSYPIIKLLHTLDGHTADINSIAILSDNYVVTGSMDTTVKIWDAHTGKLLHTLDNHTEGSIYSVYTLPNGNIVTRSNNGIVKIWPTGLAALFPDPQRITLQDICAVNALLHPTSTYNAATAGAIEQ